MSCPALVYAKNLRVSEHIHAVDSNGDSVWICRSMCTEVSRPHNKLGVRVPLANLLDGHLEVDCDF